ncbi:hypothetical protein BaRGS_00031530 [Batillaria attramentaria]|uniref:Uncharacterized protein n=1 Tax=Batillaria attramentaria TaxID=370345 RepID=A0ABD0JRF8_9CAEN
METAGSTSTSTAVTSPTVMRFSELMISTTLQSPPSSSHSSSRASEGAVLNWTEHLLSSEPPLLTSSVTCSSDDVCPYSSMGTSFATDVVEQTSATTARDETFRQSLTLSSYYFPFSTDIISVTKMVTYDTVTRTGYTVTYDIEPTSPSEAATLASASVDEKSGDVMATELGGTDIFVEGSSSVAIATELSGTGSVSEGGSFGGAWATELGGTGTVLVEGSFAGAMATELGGTDTVLLEGSFGGAMATELGNSDAVLVDGTFGGALATELGGTETEFVDGSFSVATETEIGGTHSVFQDGSFGGAMDTELGGTVLYDLTLQTLPASELMSTSPTSVLNMGTAYLTGSLVRERTVELGGTVYSDLTFDTMPPSPSATEVVTVGESGISFDGHTLAGLGGTSSAESVVLSEKEISSVSRATHKTTSISAVSHVVSIDSSSVSVPRIDSTVFTDRSISTDNTNSQMQSSATRTPSANPEHNSISMVVNDQTSDGLIVTDYATAEPEMTGRTMSDYVLEVSIVPTAVTQADQIRVTDTVDFESRLAVVTTDEPLIVNATSAQVEPNDRTQDGLEFSSMLNAEYGVTGVTVNSLESVLTVLSATAARTAEDIGVTDKTDDGFSAIHTDGALSGARSKTTAAYSLASSLIDTSGVAEFSAMDSDSGASGARSKPTADYSLASSLIDTSGESKVSITEYSLTFSLTETSVAMSKTSAEYSLASSLTDASFAVSKEVSDYSLASSLTDTSGAMSETTASSLIDPFGAISEEAADYSLDIQLD